MGGQQDGGALQDSGPRGGPPVKRVQQLYPRGAEDEDAPRQRGGVGEDSQKTRQHRDHRRRDRRSDGGRRQGRPGAYYPPGAEEPRRRHPPDFSDPETDGRRYHRPDQVEPPGAYRLRGDQRHRQPRRPRRAGGRAAAGQRRYALPSSGDKPPDPRPGDVRLEQGGRDDRPRGLGPPAGFRGGTIQRRRRRGGTRASRPDRRTAAPQRFPL